MDLADFMCGIDRNAWIKDCGLNYYVRKSPYEIGLIELANCYADDSVQFGYFRFMRKYVTHIPFMAEQVLNISLARHYERTGWIGKRDESGVPSYVSPLTQQLFPLYSSRFNAIGCADTLEQILC